MSIAHTPEPKPKDRASDALDITLWRQAEKDRKTFIWAFIIAFCGFLLVVVSLGIVAILLIPPETIEAVQQGVMPRGAGEGDFLKVFIPVIVAAFVVLAGWLGLKRLEQIDQEINIIRSELIQRLREEREHVGEDYRVFNTLVEKRLSGIQASIGTHVDRHVKEALSATQESLESLEKKASQAVKVIDERAILAESRLKPFAWLEKHKEEMEHLVEIQTIGVAHKRVSRFFGEGKADMALAIAAHAVSESLPGANADFHNLAAVLAKHDQFPLAVQTIENGLLLFPHDVDLLSDGIQYHSSVGNFLRAEELYKTLDVIDRSQWNWRAFVFVGDYLELSSRIDEALDIYKSFQIAVPDDERAYSQPGGYYFKLGQYRKAIEVLEVGVAKIRRATQTALRLCESYLAIGEYEKAICAADRALEAAADEQPSAKVSAILWQRALAEDSLIHKKVSQQVQKDASYRVNEEVLRLAKKCVTDYHLAISMPDVIGEFSYRGPGRMLILHALLSQHGASPAQISDVFGADQQCSEQAGHSD